jgi:hypothetical protein
MTARRASALHRVAVLASITCTSAIAIPFIRSWLARSFVHVTHTTVHTERIIEPSGEPQQLVHDTEVSG